MLSNRITLMTHAAANNTQKMRVRSRMNSLLSVTFKPPLPEQANYAFRLAAFGTKCRARHR
jgi:hypothetical protein